jgi:Cu+-exporting ATPase
MKSDNLAGKEFRVDPVCGMKVDPSNTAFQTRYRDEKYYFCSEACKFLFERDPEKYLNSPQ